MDPLFVIPWVFVLTAGIDRSSAEDYHDYDIRRDSTELAPKSQEADSAYSSTEQDEICSNCGPSGVNFWQFKRASREFGGNIAGGSDWNIGAGLLTYGDGHAPSNQGYMAHGSKRKPNSGGEKTAIIIHLPKPLAKIFNKKKKKGRGRNKNSQRPPHKQYAPSFISYGPIYGPPPPPINPPQGQPPPQTAYGVPQGQPPPQTTYGVPQGQPPPQTTYGVPQGQPPPQAAYGVPELPVIHRSSTTAATFKEHPAPNRPVLPQPWTSQAPWQTQQSQPWQTQGIPIHTTSHPPPRPTATYGPRYLPPQQTQPQKSHYSVSNQPPTRYQPPSQWNTIDVPKLSPPQPMITIEPSQSFTPVNDQPQQGYQQPQPTNYLPPTQAPGWTTWDPPTPTCGKCAPSGNGGYQTGSGWQENQSPPNQLENQIPMNYGPPMHNFGPPMSSYGQPPPIIGEPPRNPYESSDIYKYPDNNQPQFQPQGGNNYHQRIDSEETLHGQASQEIYQEHRGTSRQYPGKSVEQNKPTPIPFSEANRSKHRAMFVRPRDQGQFPRQQLRRPNQLLPKRRPQQKVLQGTQNRPQSQSNGRIEDSRSQESQEDRLKLSSSEGGGNPNNRPAPKFDTNYNSPGLSQDPKIVEWMPHSSKNYNELPGRRQRSKVLPNRYTTLPDSLHDYTPDPEHDKYPKITYDTLTKRTLPTSSLRRRRRPIIQRKTMTTETLSSVTDGTSVKTFDGGQPGNSSIIHDKDHDFHF